MMETLFTVATSLPWILVWVIAGVLAAIWWSRHPTVSALVVTASALHVLTTVAGRVLPMMLHQRGESIGIIGIVSTGIGLVGLVGSVCLVAAVFVGRQGSGPNAVPPG
jgi:hypothetical protein